MRVIWTNLALQTFKEEIQFLIKANPKVAYQVQSSILKKIDLLVDTPHLGAKYMLNDVRKLTITKYSYSVYYRLRSQRIEILRIRHNSRKPLRVFH